MPSKEGHFTPVCYEPPQLAAKVLGLNCFCFREGSCNVYLLDSQEHYPSYHRCLSFFLFLASFGKHRKPMAGDQGHGRFQPLPTPPPRDDWLNFFLIYWPTAHPPPCCACPSGCGCQIFFSRPQASFMTPPGGGHSSKNG